MFSFVLVTAEIFECSSPHSLVSIATGYGLVNWGSRVQFLVEAGNFSLYHHIQNSSGAQPASYPMGIRGSFPVGKWPGHEADYSPPSSAEIRNAWIYTSTPPRRLNGMVLSSAQLSEHIISFNVACPPKRLSTHRINNIRPGSRPLPIIITFTMIIQRTS
jgi:hypothetical protein